MNSIESGLRISGSAIAVNVIFALIKTTTGIVGNSYALIADGIESTMDIVSEIKKIPIIRGFLGGILVTLTGLNSNRFLLVLLVKR